MKKAAVEMLGGQCVLCGWSGPLASYQFHHRDSSNKEFAISALSNKSWSKIKVEVEKCDLLCANCHLALHGEKSEEFIAAAEGYKGTMLI